LSVGATPSGVVNDAPGRKIRIFHDGIPLALRLEVSEARTTWSYDEPTVMWRMCREDGRSVHAVIDPRQGMVTVVWFINDRPLGRRAFQEWSGALRWSDQLRTQNWKAGWRPTPE
jgi:hypothetical protein